MEARTVFSTDNHLSLVNQTSKIIKKNPLDEFPDEIILKIFLELPSIDLGRCGLVSKQWRAYSNDESLWKRIPENAFGAKQWKEYFGLKVDEPSLPLDIQKILKSQCPFSEKGIKVEETHLLVLIPGKSRNGTPLTLKTFGEWVAQIFPKFDRDGYGYIWDAAKECGDNGKSHWVLMKKKILTGSVGKSFNKHKKQIKKKGKGNYQVPGALEVVVCAISEYARSGGNTRLFSDYPCSYTRCQDQISIFQLCVGSFVKSGLHVNRIYFRDKVGVVPLRRF